MRSKDNISLFAYYNIMIVHSHSDSEEDRVMISMTRSNCDVVNLITPEKR